MDDLLGLIDWPAESLELGPQYTPSGTLPTATVVFSFRLSGGISWGGYSTYHWASRYQSVDTSTLRSLVPCLSLIIIIHT